MARRCTFSVSVLPVAGRFTFSTIVVPASPRRCSDTYAVVFPSIEADCVEGGGKALFDRYTGLIEELPFGDPVRSAIELSVLGGQVRMSFDTAGRITLPEQLCEQFGLSDWVVLVGLGDRFQIWNREAFQAHRAAQRDMARAGLAELRAQQRAARLGAA